MSGQEFGSRIFRIAPILAVIALLALALLARSTAYFESDVAITQALQSFRLPGLGALMWAVSWPGYRPQAAVVVVTVMLLTLVSRRYWEGVMLGFSAGTAHLLNLGLKAFVQRPRPSADVVTTSKLLSTNSFPSGHVMLYLGFFGFVCFLALTLLRPSWQRAVLLLVCGAAVGLVGLSRIYLGAHWASDVLGGYLAGGVVLVLTIRVYRWGIRRLSSVRDEEAIGR